MEFLIYELTAEALHLGERAKGNLFKPCVRTIPYSGISGALSRQFGPIQAVGFLEKGIDVEILTYAPRERVADSSKIPLQVEYLVDVLATVVVVPGEAAGALPTRFPVALGGMRSRGFGRAEMKFRERSESRTRQGRLRVRLPEKAASAFGVVKVLAPVYGYLFEPTPGTHTGVYVRSLFEGSRAVAPEVLLKLDGGML
ncbi:MAG: hypothetical protein ACRD2O_04190 [Terriglobia bacterium]